MEVKPKLDYGTGINCAVHDRAILTMVHVIALSMTSEGTMTTELQKDV
jgi:hypothetical protein